MLESSLSKFALDNELLVIKSHTTRISHRDFKVNLQLPKSLIPCVHIACEVVLNGGNDTLDKLEKNKHVLIDSRSLPTI